MKRRSVILALGAIALAGGLHVQTAMAAEPLRIGLLLSLTGPAAPFGIPERDAVEVLVKKMNDEGGIDGRKIELSVYDDATNPTESARGATHLIQQNKVVAIIGSTTGSGTLAGAPVAMRYEVPMVAPNGTLAVTLKENKFYPWVFRSLSGDLTNTAVMFERAVAGGAKKVGLFYQEDAYGKNTADYIAELAKKANVELVETATAPLKALDLTSQATKIRNAKPDVVLIQASAPTLGAAFVRAARQVGLEAPMWAPVGLGQKSFIDASGEAGNGVRIVLVANWDDPGAGLQEFGKLLNAAGKPPQGFGEVIGSNALFAITEAVKTIKGDVTGRGIRDAIEKLCGIKTYSEGKMCFSADVHDGWTGELLVSAEIRDGKFKNLK
ncbi:MAG: ABC transporter substrate-binding protein [Rhizobiales bacterium]|nr:ABC transporter substrate-binding protein [Hyphomicrobiales bacterium]